MAKEVRWSVKADQDRLAIFDYWVNRNKSASYSIKLAKLFSETTEHIALYPDLGIPTSDPTIKIKMTKPYLIYYQIAKDHIKILTIWDSRRNPKKLKYSFK